MTTATVNDTHDASHDSMLDEEWLAAPRTRSRVRLVMVGALAAALCFLGGALVQKQWGTDQAATAAPGGLPGGLAGGGGGFPSGDFPSGFPGAGGGAAPGQGQGTSTDQGGAAEETTDSVIGTVVAKDGDTWVVEDLGGKRHQITVGEARVIRESEITGDDVAKGERVQIAGTTSGDQLQASDITLR